MSRSRPIVLTAAAATLLALVLAAAPRPAPAEESPSPPTVVITGANRGLGLEFARQFSASGARVIATARRPEAADDLKALGVRIEQLDVADGESVARFAQRLGDERVDILINNAGIANRVQSLAQVDFDVVERIYQVNCIGPMRVTQALLPALRKGDRKLIINITSGLGSIEQNTGGGFYGYRQSKAALNMFTRSIAAELRPESFICIAMSPGWVRTDMGGPQARLSPEESISAMRSVIAKLTPQETGRFFSYTGEEVPW